MSRRDRVIVAALFAAAIGSYVGTPVLATATTGETVQYNVQNNEVEGATTFKRSIVSLTNKYRKDAGLEKLKVNKTVELAAQRKANEMAKRGEFAHVLSNNKTPWSELENVRFRFESAGENLAVHFSEPQELVMAWYKSPTHKANMLNKKFTSIGIGISKGFYEGDEGYFFVQLMVKPQ